MTRDITRIFSPLASYRGRALAVWWAYSRRGVRS